MTYHGRLLEIVRKCIPKQMGEAMTSKYEDDSVLLKVKLKKLEKEGIKLFLNGIPSTTEFIVENCINEDTVYMPDYITDECGKIKEIRYDRISADD